MKSSSVTLDRVLHRILTEEDVGYFTIMELRDAYLRYVEPNGITLPQIRVYLYDQVRRLIALRWASYHSERKTRGQRFVMNEKPARLKLQLVKPKMGMAERAVTEVEPKDVMKPSDIDTGSIITTSQDEPDVLTVVTLQKMLKEVRLDFLTTLGSTERYRLLIDEVPDLKSTLESELTAARDHSSRLLGHINALEATLQKLGAM